MRNTYQRTKVKSVLNGVNNHLSAEEVFDLVNQDIKSPKVSKATVYRTLNVMYDHGEILRIISNNVAYYDGNAIKHHHFICKNCGKIIDVPLKYEESINRKMAIEMNLKIDEHETIFYGLCNSCLHEKEN
jgi:Fe2+ or Zn2+ uptake regulation protein